MSLPIKPSDILIPKKNLDMTKWAVIACDQHTSNQKYWTRLKLFTDNSYSTLNLILPECYLSNEEKLTKKIISSMKGYLSDGIFDSFFGYVFVERTLKNGKIRHGIVAALDLDSYSYKNEDKALTRASEATIIQRLPPRVKIRSKSPLELPHIMILIDDKDNLAMKDLSIDECKLLYDAELNMRGGHIRGGLIKDASGFENSLEELMQVSKQKYGDEFLFAVGDGNHSLAAAKSYYEEQKKKKADTSLCRYALVEIVNIYDEAIDFEPIHRLLSGVNASSFASYLQNRTAKYNEPYVLKFLHGQSSFYLPSNTANAVSVLDELINDYLSEHGGSVDYIHGINELNTLIKNDGAVGIELKSMDKSELFPYVAKHGALPKKMFSMGHAEDKRYYIEARRINH